MDAVAYQMSFDKEQLALLCANYDRRIDSLGAENKKLKAENAKLWKLCAGLLTGYECGYGELCKGCTWDGLGDPKTFPCLPRVKARELGVEV